MVGLNLKSNGSIGRSNGSSKNIRCHHCAGPLLKDMETRDWTIPPLIRDRFSMIGSAVGGTTSAFYEFNHGIDASCPKMGKRTNVVAFFNWCGTVPALAQLVSSPYHAALSSPTLPPSSKDVASAPHI